MTPSSGVPVLLLDELSLDVEPESWSFFSSVDSVFLPSVGVTGSVEVEVELSAGVVVSDALFSSDPDSAFVVTG